MADDLKDTTPELPPLKGSHSEIRKTSKEYYEKQSKIFQNVLAHVDEQVRTQMDKVCCTDHLRVLMIYTGSGLMFNVPLTFSTRWYNWYDKYGEGLYNKKGLFISKYQGK